MDDIGLAVKANSRLEMLLKAHYHAEGTGLNQLINSCQERLPHDVIAKLRFIASTTDKIVNEEGYQIEDMKRFMLACKESEKELLPRSNRTIWGIAIFLIVAVTGGAVWFYIENWGRITGK